MQDHIATAKQTSFGWIQQVLNEKIKKTTSKNFFKKITLTVSLFRDDFERDESNEKSI